MISVLIAVRSGWKFLPEAVASVEAQTYGDWECLIGVNGHEAGSKAHSLAQSLVSPKVWPMLLGGCTNKPQTLNTLAAMCHGEYVAILDADDLWEPEKLATQLPLMEAYDVVGTGAEYFGDHTGPIPVVTGPVSFAQLLECNQIVNSSVLMRREFAVWPDTDGLDDYPLWLTLAKEDRRLFNVSNVLTRIRSHAGQWFPSRDNSAEIRREFAERCKQPS